MPKSRIRRRAAYTPPPTRSRAKSVSPPWLAPLMVTMFLLGIAWLTVFYLTNGDVWGLRELGNWNLAVGFGFIMAGFAISTQWR
ncbi:MAG: cell division protein CrgA [Mycobacterium leprae]